MKRSSVRASRGGNSNCQEHTCGIAIDDVHHGCQFRKTHSSPRRDFVKAGVLTAWGVSLSDVIGCSPSAVSLADTPSVRKAKSCILLWLDGGPSHLETFDLKPDAPAEVRGPFAPIATSVPGISICELLPETAKRTQQLSIIRSMTSPLGEHGIANHYLLTGYKPTPSLLYPGFGSVVSHVRANSTTLPAHIAIPESRAGGSGFLGEAFAPFETKGDPSSPGFRVRNLELYPDVDEARLLRRRDFLHQFDRTQRARENASDFPSEGTDLDQAFRMITSQEAKSAFDLSQEPDDVRARYGPRMFGQSCLLARRLVERGVPFVTVTNTGWDTHEGLVTQLKLGYSGAKVGVGLVPTFDLGFSALIGDLADRGLLDETLVVAMGEFGRTPKLNTRGGRDHWPRVFSVVLAGGGIRGGQVIGSSDRVGESPSDSPVTPSDLAFSIYSLLGIDPHRELRTSDGRPIPINQGGQMIRGLV
ncbi:MAG: DUF1501 domain-containing protein [Planctomycetaceae bacterium]